MGKNKPQRKSTGIVVLTILVWLLFISCIALICYLSFQSGEDAKALGKGLIYTLAERHYETSDIPTEVMDEFIYKIRQGGRVIIFFILGLLGTLAVHLSFCRLNWFLRALVSIFMLCFVAVFTERFKIYLPTRHFSSDEMLLSIIGAMLGFIFISVVTLVYSVIRLIIKGLKK